MMELETLRGFGPCDCIAFTRARLLEDGVTKPLADFLLLVLARDSDHTRALWVPSLVALREAVQMLEPSTLMTRTTARDYHCDDLIDFLRGRRERIAAPAAIH